MTVTGTPGTGTITLNAASSTYQTFAAAYAGNATVDILITDGTAWEVARACTYTNSGTTVTRGTLEASSTGSAISLTSAAVVSQIPTAQWGNWLESAMQAVTPGGRLTLTSGTPVTTSDVTGATNVYYTPYVHDTITLWDGARWIPVTFTEITHALGTVVDAKNYDFFAYLSSGALAIEKLVWTNDTTRATAVTLQDGRYCKSGDKTRLLLGTIRTTSTTTTAAADVSRFVNNIYNQVSRRLYKYDATGHTYNGGYRQWNNAAGNKVEFVVSSPVGTTVGCGCAGEVAVPPAIYGIVAQKLDATNSYDGVPAYINPSVTVTIGAGAASYMTHTVTAGYHYIAATESSASAGTATFNTFSLAGEISG